jgi:hypothetical protein
MLVYGWTDVVSKPIELAPGARRQNTLCIAETFPVKETGKEILRQVRVQDKLRIVVGYETPTWRIIDQPQGKGRRTYVRMADNANHWTFGEVVLEILIPCPNGASSSDCLSPPQIFPGEHDVHTFELDPPAIEFQPPPLPILPIDRPLPPKPQSQLLYFLSTCLRIAGQSETDPCSLYQTSPLWSAHNAYWPVTPGFTGTAVMVNLSAL